MGSTRVGVESIGTDESWEWEGDGGDEWLEVLESGRAWPGDRETCEEAESVVEVTAKASASAGEPEGDFLKTAGRGSEAVMLFRRGSAELWHPEAVIISQNWKRGG